MKYQNLFSGNNKKNKNASKDYISEILRTYLFYKIQHKTLKQKATYCEKITLYV